MTSANIARHLDAMAAAQPRTPALKVPRGRNESGEIDYLVLSFAELAAEVGAWQARLTERGVRLGDRALVMVKPGLPLIASAFALFRLGAIPVVIDPGMGLRNFLGCVARTRPRALVGIPLAQIASRLFRSQFGSIEVRVKVPGSLTAQLAEPGRVSRGGPQTPPPEPFAAAPDSLAAILFTSGSTGAPKGVRYEHGQFEAQIALIRHAYEIEPGEIDLPLLPIFALFNPALGMTSVIPEIDPRRPAAVDPAKIVQAIRQENVTNSFGSPTLWRIVGDHCRARGISLPSLRRVLCAGAPVPTALWEGSRDFLPRGRLHSPYGATEALPLTSISADDIGTTGFSAPGAPVGRPLPGIAVRIIALDDRPIASLADARTPPQGEIGEIIASGKVVTRAYDAAPEATAAAKIADPAVPGGVWHRMGDCGTLDKSGALWFCGRKAERVVSEAGTLHTEPCERVFRRHPRAARCALIGLGEPGRQRPALVAETAVRSAAEGAALAAELRTLGAGDPTTAPIRLFFFNPEFPVDVRHNAKIHRLALARWAATARGFETP